jgi:hypothetical protein
MNKLALRFGLPAELGNADRYRRAGRNRRRRRRENVAPGRPVAAPEGSQGPNQDRHHHVPDYNAQFCHYYHQTPGDLPNFYVAEENSEGPNKALDVNDLDELLDFLSDPSAY